MQNEDINCKKHWKGQPAFVCQHLNSNVKVGFHESFPSDRGFLDREEDLEAWCDECEKILVIEGEWNDKSEAFANIKVVCNKCYFEMKYLNKE